MKSLLKIFFIPTTLAFGITTKSSAAIVAVTPTSSTSFTIDDRTFLLSNNSGNNIVFTTEIGSLRTFELRFSSTFTNSIRDMVMRSSDTGVARNSSRAAVTLTSFGLPVNNLQSGDDNWILISLEVDETEWDTAVQLKLDGSSVSFLLIWHDNSSSGENVLQNANGNFNNIVASPVPEPSSLFFLLLAYFRVVTHRSRTSLI